MKKTLFLAALLAVSIASANTPLRQSTLRVVQVCGVVAVGDGFTPVTTLALGAADEAEAIRAGTATLDISGATFAAVTGADGCYSLTLDATATNTVGDLTVVLQDDSLILPMREKFIVYEENVYDSIFAAAGDLGTILNATSTLASITALNDISAAQVNIEVDTALTDYNGPTSAEFDARTLLSAAYFDPSTDTVGNVTLVATTTSNIDMRGTNAAATAAALATVDTNVDSILVDTAAGGAGPWTTGSAGSGLTPLASGTAQGGTATAIQLAASSTFANDILNTTAVKITSGTGAGQSNVIIDYVSSTDTATVAYPWITNPDATSVYEIVQGSVNVASWNGAAVTTNIQDAVAFRQEMDTNSTQLQAIVTDTSVIGTPVGASISADIAAIPTAVEIWNTPCEDQGGGYSCREVISMVFAEALGIAVYTPGTRTWVVSDPSGTEVRFTIVYGTDLDGDRDTSTPAPFTP
jgi:hypothetical protein